MAIIGSRMVCSIAHLEHEKCLTSDILVKSRGLKLL